MTPRKTVMEIAVGSRVVVKVKRGTEGFIVSGGGCVERVFPSQREAMAEARRLCWEPLTPEQQRIIDTCAKLYGIEVKKERPKP